MERYERYKESGISWAGQIPESWYVRKGKFCYKIQAGAPFDSALFSNVGTMPLIRIRDITSGHSDTYYTGTYTDDYIINNEDLLIGMDGDFNIRWWADGEGLLNQRCCRVFEASDINKKFIYYVLPFYLKEVNDLAYSTTVKHLSNDDIVNAMIPVPALKDQAAIAAYLDDKVGQIDSVIAEAKASIDEYKSWKASIIYEAVTKGLDPNAEMKDSGVEWIGEVPQHWESCKIKNVATVLRGGSPRPIDDYLTDDPSGYNWIKIGDTIKGSKYITRIKQKIIPEGLNKTRQVHNGDLLLTNSMSFGQAYILAVDGCIHDGWVCLSNLRNVEKEFLYFVLVSPLCTTQFENQVAGGVVQNLNVDKIGVTTIFVPPMVEQLQIIDYLNELSSQIDSLISEKESLIADLEAYKKSLIFEVVTGKRKVV